MLRCFVLTRVFWLWNVCVCVAAGGGGWVGRVLGVLVLSGSA